MLNPVTVADLRDQIGTNGPRPLLYCRRCGSEQSANAGDYFMAPANRIFKCCGVNMVLVTKHQAFTLVDQ